MYAIRSYYESAHAAAYVATANEMQMLSQRIAAVAQQAIQGIPESFAHLDEARKRFDEALKLLRNNFV